MALAIPSRSINDPDPAGDVNDIVTEVNRLGGIVDGDLATFLNAVDVATDARTLGIKNVVTPPGANPVSAVKVYSESGTLKVRNPSGDVLLLDGPGSGPRPDDQGFISWAYDPVTVGATTIQLTSGTIYLARLSIRRAASISTLWLNVGTAASGVTSGQTFAGLVGPTGTVLTTAGAATAIGSTGVRSIAITPQTVAQGYCWVALLFVATTMPFLTSTATGSVLNANLTASAFRFAINGTSQTALPGSFTLASNTETNARGVWVAAS